MARDYEKIKRITDNIVWNLPKESTITPEVIEEYEKALEEAQQELTKTQQGFSAFNPMYNSDSPVNIGQVINPNTVMKVNVEKMATWARNYYSEEALNWQLPGSDIKHLLTLEFTQVPTGNLDYLYGDYTPLDDKLGFSGRLYVSFNMYMGEINFQRGYFDPRYYTYFVGKKEGSFINLNAMNNSTINAFIDSLLQFGNFDILFKDIMNNYDQPELEQPLYMLTRVMALQSEINPEDESFDSQNLQMVNIDGVDFIEFEQQTVNS